MQTDGFESRLSSGGDKPPKNLPMACVVIGRNEGKRLIESLRSVQAAGLPLVYVDSGSIDGSAEAAQDLGIRSLSLDANRPFSAARARNYGLDEVMRLWPETQYVLFLDGDCTLEPNFPLVAAGVLGGDEACAIVTGHLMEQSPDASVYNRLCAMEWRAPPGSIEDFGQLGGIMAARVFAVLSVGGFNEQMQAGEDSELGVRLALAGHTAKKLDTTMATHDADLRHFNQWWKRAVRGGHALAHRYALNGRTTLFDCRREFLSTLFWGLAVPTSVAGLFLPTHGLSLTLLTGYLVLGWRVYQHGLKSGYSRSDSLLQARFTILAKFANALGVLHYLIDRTRLRSVGNEYKYNND